jgi:hypothetical protein
VNKAHDVDCAGGFPEGFDWVIVGKKIEGGVL